MAERSQVQLRRNRLQESRALQRSLRIIFFVLLSLGGSMVRLPLPTGPVALETFPGYFAALAFGWADGALIAGISHLVVAVTTGFPLGIWLHLLAALQMAIWAACFWYISKRTGLLMAIVTITFLHALVSVVYTLPIWNMVMFSGLLLPLAIAAAVNLFLAALVFRLGSRRNPVH